MTSNAGSNDKTIGVGFNKTQTDITKEKTMKALKEFLRPEFISRIDEIITFRQLSKDDFSEIAGLMLSEMKSPLSEKNITLEYDEKALKAIAEKSFGKSYNARDIRRVIRQEVEDKAAELIIEKASELSEIVISADENGDITVEGRKDGE